MSGRLPDSPTQIFDPKKPVKIHFRGRSITAFEGDTVASALLAAGVDTFSRSFKYHRRRAPACLSGQCSRCTMNVDGRMHIKTCQTPVREGMVVEPQGPIAFDPAGAADAFSWAMPTGFYYKMFYKPQWFWKLVKEVIRAMPGNMAKVKALPAKAHFDSINLSPDLLVIGGGLAGMEAAITAADAGVRVVIVEADPQLGGFEAFQAEAGFRRTQASISRLAAFPNITLLTGTRVTAIYPDGLAVCMQESPSQSAQDCVERSYLVRAGATVIATGAGSMPMVFAHNDRPGIILPEAAQRMVHLWGIKPKGRVLLAGGDDHIGEVALALYKQGVDVVGVVDFREAGLRKDLQSALADHGIPVWSSYTLTDTRGRRRVTSATVTSIDGLQSKRVRCDTIVASSGRYPRHKLLGQIGTRMLYDAALNFYLPEQLPANYEAAGRLLGLEDPNAIMRQGAHAAINALKHLGVDTNTAKVAAAEPADEAPMPVTLQPVIEDVQLKSKTFVCYCHDVSAKNIEQAIDEGFDKIETCKRYTTATQGACQGGMCEANFAHLLARKRPALSARVLPTTRPPVTSMSLGAMAVGYHDHPQVSPLYHTQLAHGGNSLRMGSWIRMVDFGDHEAESLAVHSTAGICDVSMFGKFRVFGPDAEKLLNRIMTRNIEKLNGNSTFYYTACNEEGVLVDDGMALKMGEHDYFVTTTAARAAVTEEWLARWCREENWQVNVVNVTDTKAGISLAGPMAREILSKLTEADISGEALPFQKWMHMEVAGVKAIVSRVGFVGELNYELFCPASQGPYLWDAIMAAGKPLGLVPFGIECLNICRLEKGHVLPGIDTDSFTNLFEASMGWALDRNKTETVGKAMLDLTTHQAIKERVIAFSIEGRSPVTEGALVVDGTQQLGRVTSIIYSPLLKKTIGFALVAPHDNWVEGGTVTFWYDSGREAQASFAKPPFYDPKGQRIRM